MSNFKKIFALTLCSATLFVGCERRHAITLDEANTFALKNYGSIIKLCKSATVNYNLHFSYGGLVSESDAKDCCKYIEQYFSFYESEKEELYSIDTENKTVTMTQSDTHTIKIDSLESCRIKSLGFIDRTDTSHLVSVVNDNYADNATIYVANNNNIVINGILSYAPAIDSNETINGIKIDSVEEQFDDDGCVSKRIVTLKKGAVIRNISTSENTVLKVTEDSSLVATYSYY